MNSEEWESTLRETHKTYFPRLHMSEDDWKRVLSLPPPPQFRVNKPDLEMAIRYSKKEIGWEPLLGAGRWRVVNY